MNRTRVCRAFTRAGVLVAVLAIAPSAFAHAELFPDDVGSGHGQLMQLAVPNEKEDASTTEIQMTLPDGFDLEHVAPVPGWTATINGQHEENGELEGGDSVTWKGELKGTELAILPFTGVAKNDGEYAFTIRQTYSDGSVVSWSGAEDSDTPAARITAAAEEHGASASHSDSSKTIAIIALVVGALGLLVGGAGLVAGRRSE